MLGESYVREFCSRYFIVRTAWLYGYNGKNFVKIILKIAKEKVYLHVVDDQRDNQTNAEDLVYYILKLALTDEYDRVYHCTGTGECSWHDFAKAIVEYAGIGIVVEELSKRMVGKMHYVTVYSRKGHHVSGKEFNRLSNNVELEEYKGIWIVTVSTIERKGLAAVSSLFLPQ